jgi:hypothetical protein
VNAHALRATCQARDIKAAFPSEPQIKHVLGLWGGVGIAPGGFEGNYELWNGSSTLGTACYLYTTDATSSAWGPPKNYHDAMAIAPYFDNGPAYYEASHTGAGSFTFDSLLYATNKPQAITNFVNSAVANSNLGEGLAGWVTAQSQYAAQCGTGQYVVHYEGGPNWEYRVGQPLSCREGFERNIATADEAALLKDVYNSSQLATAMTNYFNTVSATVKSAMPGLYLSVSPGQRWAYAWPDSYAVGGVSTGTEGGGLTANPTWAALTTRNATVT